MSFTLGILLATSSAGLSAESKSPALVHAKKQETIVKAQQERIDKMGSAIKKLTEELNRALTNAPTTVVISTGRPAGSGELEVRVRLMQEGLDTLGHDLEKISSEWSKKRKEDATSAKAEEELRRTVETRLTEVEVKLATLEAAKKQLMAAKNDLEAEDIRLQKELSKFKADLAAAPAGLKAGVNTSDILQKSLDAESTKLKELQLEVTKLRTELAEVKAQTSPDKILTGLLGAGGVAGLMGLYRSFGPSRGKEDIAKLSVKLDEVQKKLP